MPNIHAFLADLQVVVVVYRTIWHECAALRSLQTAAESLRFKIHVYVHDNSPGAPEKNVTSAALDAVYAQTGKNLGVSEPYNRGAELAAAARRRWLLLLDQDFEFEPKLLEAYAEFTGLYSDEVVFCPRLAAQNLQLSPCREFLGQGWPVERMTAGVYSLDRYFILNNGLMIAVKAFNAAGGYSPAVPLDFSDHYFVRALRSVYATFVLIDYDGAHEFSNFQTNNLASALNRFRFYCLGSRNFSKAYGGTLLAGIFALRQALRLIMTYRSLAFLRAFADHFVRARPIDGEN
jgi:GT2 family glycosyltransferase